MKREAVGGVAVEVMEVSRQRSMGHHLAEAAKLDGELDSIAMLAQQLTTQRLLPVVGAGASYDCGVRVASEISEDLHRDYTATYDDPDWDLQPTDLAGIAEDILQRTDQMQVVRDLGFPDKDLWRRQEALGEHFCVYCVLARMVRERIVKGKAFGFNYDCGAEAGLDAEGFVCGKARPGGHFPDHARIVSDAVTYINTKTEGDEDFTLYKAHGCAVRYRELVADSKEEQGAEGIVVCKSQLESWDTEGRWSRDAFRDTVKHHAVLLVGFSAQDPKFAIELGNVLAEVFDYREAEGKPRVIAIDLDPAAEGITKMIEAGLDKEAPADGAVTGICTKDSTATAAMLVLLAERLALSLSEALHEHGVTLPEELDPRLATLTVSAPTMLRWYYLARKPDDNELMQEANQLAEDGYVPLAIDLRKTVYLNEARRNLRERLGRSAEESSAEALSNHGFIVKEGIAYMPVGIEQDELVTTCADRPELDRIQKGLPHPSPSSLDCVMVSGDGKALRGVNLQTGKEVDLD